MRDAQGDFASAVSKLISQHISSAAYVTAREADKRDRQKYSVFSTINKKFEEKAKFQFELKNNFLNNLVMERVNFSLGHPVQFTEPDVREKFGIDFDQRLSEVAHHALEQGVSFVFWNLDHIHEFEFLEFAPLYSEETGELMGGARFWRISSDKPVQVEMYEQDGFTKLTGGNYNELKLKEEKKPYKYTTSKSEVMEEPEVIGVDHYSDASGKALLPIIPFYASPTHESVYPGIKQDLDAYDLVDSGYANDMKDCSEIFWVIENAGGMDDEDVDEFIQRLQQKRVVTNSNSDEVHFSRETQEVPVTARESFLASRRAAIYEKFNCLDVHVVAAGATNDHIDAAYKPIENRAKEFENCIADGLQKLLVFIGSDAQPIFTRDKIQNMAETISILQASESHLDERTYLELHPLVNNDNIDLILARKAEEELSLAFEEEE